MIKVGFFSTITNKRGKYMLALFQATVRSPQTG